MITIAVTNQKGGVGKTTIAYNLAQIMAKRRKKVLTVDNDPQGNLTISFLESPTDIRAHIADVYDGKASDPMQISKDLYLVGSDITLAPMVERDFQVVFKLKEWIYRLNESQQSAKFDFVIIDCSPSFGHLHLAALNAADYVVIPVKPAPYALSGMKDLFETIETAKNHLNTNLKVLGIVINQVDGRKPVIEREMEEVLRETYGDLVLKAKINKRVKVEESPAFQQPITVYDPRGPSAKEFRAMTNEILRRIKNMGNENDRKE